MSSLYESIDLLCKGKGISASQMCLDLGMSRNFLTELKYGRKNGARKETLEKIADYFHVSVGTLYDYCDDAETSEKKGLPSEYFSLSDEERETVNNLIRMLSKKKRR